MTEDQENLPLLHPVAEHRRVFAAQNPGRERWVTCCGACFCCAVFVFIVVPTVATSVTRNRDCDATKLAGQTPPYGGQLVPKETVLVERAGWFQLSKLVEGVCRSRGVGAFGRELRELEGLDWEGRRVKDVPVQHVPARTARAVVR